MSLPHRYEKRPVIVEAWPYDILYRTQIMNWLTTHGVFTEVSGSGIVFGLTERDYLEEGNWIVRSLSWPDKFYIVTDAEFRREYRLM